MSKNSHGLLTGRTRHLARHHKPSTLSIRENIKFFKKGDSVAIVPKGNMKNIPHPRYRGRIAKVIDSRGSAYVVELKMMNATKRLVIPALHLQKV